MMPRRFALALPIWLASDLPAAAQALNLDLGDTSSTGRVVQLILVMTVLSLAPSILVMVTSFTRIVVVLSLLRSAIGTQQTPPNAVLVSLALFLTAFVMAPTLEVAYRDGLLPLIEEKIDETEAIARIAAPLQRFMLAQVGQGELKLFLDLAKVGELATPEATPLKALVPAFILSELKRAFEIGFLLFVPFVVIDMVVASILMSMGMMMLPPVTISLPFKLIFFVLVDGWFLVAGSLVQSFGPT
jgi:flagellar biosynthesis protein FliP